MTIKEAIARLSAEIPHTVCVSIEAWQHKRDSTPDHETMTISVHVLQRLPYSDKHDVRKYLGESVQAAVDAAIAGEKCHAGAGRLSTLDNVLN